MEFDQHFGVAHRDVLRELGHGRVELTGAVRAGELTWLRRGWYATPVAHPTVVEAVRAGGVASCLSALQLRGVWVPPFVGVHVRGGDRARRADPDRFCSQWGPDEPVGLSVDGIAIALRHAVRCLDIDEDRVVIFDSILNQKLLELCDLEAELSGAPRRIRRLLSLACSGSDAGTETKVRLRLRAKNIKLAVQQLIPGVGKVDLLIGKRLIIEVDGQQYHSSSAQFESDRARDLEAVSRGYIVIRLSYKQVMYGWEEAEDKILSIIRRREHLRAPQPLGYVPEESQDYITDDWTDHIA